MVYIAVELGKKVMLPLCHLKTLHINSILKLYTQLLPRDECGRYTIFIGTIKSVITRDKYEDIDNVTQLVTYIADFVQYELNVYKWFQLISMKAKPL